MTLTLVDLPDPAPTVPRDGWGRPLVVPKAGGAPVALTRTTTFIDTIEDKSNLIDWGKRMVFLGASLEPSILHEAKGLNPEDKDDKRKLNDLAERAMSISGAHYKREKGTHLHTLSEHVDRGEPLPGHVTDKDLDDMAAYMMGTVELTMEHIEQFVVIERLRTAGTFDRTALYSGLGPHGEWIEGRFIADLKTGSVEWGALKMAAQLAVYSRGERYDFSKFPVDTENKKVFAAWKKTKFSAEEAQAAYSPMPPVSQDWGIIIHLPAGQAQCDLYWVDLELGWAAALLSREIYEMRRKGKGAMLPFVSQVTQT